MWVLICGLYACHSRLAIIRYANLRENNQSLKVNQTDETILPDIFLTSLLNMIIVLGHKEDLYILIDNLCDQ